VGRKPKRLPFELVKLVGEMYQAGANRYCNMQLFNARPLEDVLADINEF